MRIFANHAHVYPDRLAPEWKPIKGTVNNLLRFMDELGIEKTVAFAHDGGEETFDTVGWFANKVKNIDRIVPFGVINPWREDAVADVRRMHEHGFKGIKLHPCVYKFSVVSEESYEVYEVAQEFNLFLVFHTGPHWYKLSHYRPILFDQIAWDFPELRFSMEHVGGRAFFYEAVGVIQNHIVYDNPATFTNPKGRIYAGVTNVFKKEHAPFYLGSDLVLELRNLVMARHMLFGTDFPHLPVKDTQHAIECIERLDVAEEEKEAILGKNLERILGESD